MSLDAVVDVADFVRGVQAEMLFDIKKMDVNLAHHNYRDG